jgi:DNA mismatch repair protein MutL
MIRRPIRVLPPALTERIAAGEVVERPASVVKELVENALDAGAARIRVEIRGGGLDLIRVADDGHGIPADELDLAFAHHGTSKIAAAADLDAIATLGFRGEALPSIVAVAEVTLTSCPRPDGEAVRSPQGHAVTYRYGERAGGGPRARSPGTTVAVRDLFRNVPGRLRFLRAQKVESARTGDLVRRYALGRPDVSFTLTFDGRPAFRSDGDGDARRTLAALYGVAAVEAMAPLEMTLPGGGAARGWIAVAGPWRSGRQHVSLFVNGRWVRMGTVLAGLEAAYRPFAPAGKHPLMLLWLDLPPSRVDPNIHPAKLDVRLAGEPPLIEALQEAVTLAFGRHPARGVELDGQLRLPLRRVGESGAEWDQRQPPDLRGLRLVAQAMDGLLLAEGSGGLYLVDQHRAHERVLYDEMAGRAERRGQALLEPALLRPAAAEAARLRERASELEMLGFGLEEFGGSAVIVRSAPAGLERLDADAVLALLADALADAADWRHRLLATAACHAAVRKGRTLPEGAARELLLRLGGTQSPAVCPHGSPLVLHLSGAMLRRLFQW